MRGCKGAVHRLFSGGKPRSRTPEPREQNTQFWLAYILSVPDPANLTARGSLPEITRSFVTLQPKHDIRKSLRPRCFRAEARVRVLYQGLADPHFENTLSVPAATLGLLCLRSHPDWCQEAVMEAIKS
jgi:hypothetical protein